MRICGRYSSLSSTMTEVPRIKLRGSPGTDLAKRIRDRRFFEIYY